VALEIVWRHAALATLYTLHWRTAGEAIDRAVLRFAAQAPRVPGVRVYHLRAAGYSVALDVDHAAQTVTVLWIARQRGPRA
jgi:hypothetical protein